MTTKQLIQDAIENLSDENLEELYKVVKPFVQASTHREPSIFSKLKQVQIEASSDFTANLLSGAENFLFPLLSISPNRNRVLWRQVEFYQRRS